MFVRVKERSEWYRAKLKDVGVNHSQCLNSLKEIVSDRGVCESEGTISVV